MTTDRELELRGSVTLLRSAMNASAGALDEDLNDEELCLLANANLAVRKAVQQLRETANDVAASAARRHLKESNHETVHSDRDKQRQR